MRVRAVLGAVCLSLTVSVVGPVAGLGVGLAIAAVADTVDVASSNRVRVQWLAWWDSRSVVRSGAWQALRSAAPEEAVAHFVSKGFAYAVRLSAETKARNADFARRVLETYPASVAPQVHAAALAAVNSRDDADRERFARGGFTAAQAADSRVRETDGARARALVEADRAYVRNLAVNAPGAQVRVSASYAVRVGSVDSDLVDFFATGWAFGARLDLEGFRSQLADSDMRWRATLTDLLAEATAAEKAAKEASGELAEQAKATAVRAWQAVGTQSTPASSAWSTAQQDAAAQAAMWADIVAAVAAATGPNWAAMADPAQANQSQWDTERKAAIEQGQYWSSVLAMAVEGEQRVRAGG